MKQKNKFFLIYLVAALGVFAITLGVLASFKKPPTIKPTQIQNTALSPEQKISQYSNPHALISVSDLIDIKNDPNLVIIDARYNGTKDFRQIQATGQIPGSIAVIRARYQDPNRWNRVASPKMIKLYLGQLGINNQNRIVIYGNDNGLQGRFYWMLKMYGCDNEIQILDGGFEKWKEAGNEASSDIIKKKGVPLSRFEFNQAKGDGSSTTNLQEMGALFDNNISGNNSNYIIVDARTSKEYESAHIPGSVNISVDDILKSDKTFKPVKEMTAVLNAKGVTPEKTIYVYSYYGGRSSLIWFVLHELMGYPNIKNYEAGLKEWRSRERQVEFGKQHS